MPKEKIKINVKERLEDNVLDLSLSCKMRKEVFCNLFWFIIRMILAIEHIPVKDIAALRRATVLDLSSNNIKFIPVSWAT